VASGRSRRAGKSKALERVSKAENATPQISTEERERRRQRAKELVEQGRLGGPVYGAMGGRAPRRRAPTMVELVAEGIREESALVLQALLDGMRDDSPLYLRIASAKACLEYERVERDLQLREGVDVRAERSDYLRDEERSLAIAQRAREIIEERRRAENAIDVEPGDEDD
jgi:hypothetical protein